MKFIQSGIISIIFMCLLMSVNARLVHGMQKVHISEHALMNHYNLCLLEQLANKVSTGIDRMASGKKQVLVGLGQSPAYLLEMIKLIDAKQNRSDRRYLNVAFSGSYFTASGGEFKIDRWVLPEYIRLGHHYRHYLDKIGLSKEALSATDTEFIIIEVAHFGEGLISFLDFFSDYPKKPSLIYLQHSLFSPIPLRFSLNSNRIIINDTEQKLLVALANADQFKDRLVSHFHFHRWESIDPTTFQPEENAPIILHQLQKFISEKPSSCPHL